MGTTDELAEAPGEARQAACAAAADRDEGARARLYLDLWERHLSLTALERQPARGAGRKPA